MNRKFAWGRACLPAAVLLVMLGAAGAAPPTPEQLFPATTTEFVAITDPTRMAADWQQTQFAQLMRDPAMRPFLSELGQTTKGFNFLLDTIGADFELVKAAAGGDLGWAVVLAAPDRVAHVLTLDMTGHTAGAQKLLTEMSKKLGEKGGRGSQRTIDGMTAVVVDLPLNRQIVYGVKDTLLVITDDLGTLQGMLQRWAGAATNSLANVPSFQLVMRRSRPLPGESALIRFYMEPVARMEATMIYFPEMKKVKGDNLCQSLRREGIDGIKGVGGVVAFQSNGTDMLVRMAAHAPQPFRAALRLAKLPNEAPINPDAWVPADLSAYATFGFDMLNAYDCFGPLFERLADEPAGTFAEIMRRVKEDKDGPQVDVRQEIMAQLQNRVTLINDATRPIGEKSERFLIAVPARSAAAEQVLVQSMRKCFEADRRFKNREVNGVQVWEFQARGKKGKDGKHEPTAGSTTIAVARGQLFISTHGSLVERVLAGNEPNLGQAADYQHFMRELTRLGMGPSSMRSFLRLDVGVEATYEMMRQSKLDRADSVYALGLLKLLKADEAGKKMKADVSKLPSYDHVSKYLGLCGSYTTTDEEGWTAVGTILKK